MNLTFTDAEPIQGSSAGRPKEPNPYTDAVKEIALKTNPTTKKPLAKQFVLEFPADKAGSHENRDKAITKVKRQTSDAGKDNTPPVTVKVAATDHKTGTGKAEKVSADKVVITFWTVTRQTRARKPAATPTPTK